MYGGRIEVISNKFFNHHIKLLLFDGAGTRASEGAEYHIEWFIREIGPNAFRKESGKKLNFLHIPSNVKCISHEAFDDMEKLTTLTFHKTANSDINIVDDQNTLIGVLAKNGERLDSEAIKASDEIRESVFTDIVNTNSNIDGAKIAKKMYEERRKKQSKTDDAPSDNTHQLTVKATGLFYDKLCRDMAKNRSDSFKIENLGGKNFLA